MNAADVWALVAGESGLLALEFDGEVFWVDSSGRESFVRKLAAWGWAGDLELYPMRWRSRALNWPLGAVVLWARVSAPAGREALAAFDPAPTVVLAAGAERTALWAMSGELTARDTERLNRRLAYRLGGKLKDAGPWFSFSPPGTVLRAGRAKPVPVTVERFDPVLHSARAVCGGLPDPPERKGWA